MEANQGLLDLISEYAKEKKCANAQLLLLGYLKEEIL